MPLFKGVGGFRARDAATAAQSARVVRTITADELPAWWNVQELAFGEAEPPERAETERAVLELDRSIAAFEGSELVGTAGIYSLRMTVPGGALPIAGVTGVAVKPTHRRRGVLTAMMRHQLDGLHEGGEAVAALLASEAAIYGRFGYGQATTRCELVIPRGSALTQVEGADRVKLTIAELEESQAACDAVYAALVPSRPGILERTGAWSRRNMYRRPHGSEGNLPIRCVLAETDGTVTGYARYVARGWQHTWESGGVVSVDDVHARDIASYAALWGFLLNQDLMAVVNVWRRPIDDPLLYLLADPRAAGPRLGDGAYVRLVDVDRALAARTYSAPVDAVLDVVDVFCPWNTGRWRLSGNGRGAVCERTTAPADLGVTARDLGAAYLGGTSLHALGRAGRVAELRSGVLAAVSQAFIHEPAPWVPYGF